MIATDRRYRFFLVRQVTGRYDRSIIEKKTVLRPSLQSIRNLPSLLIVVGMLIIRTWGLAGTLVYAHRGAHDKAPENTMAAFRICVDRGLSIELDVYLSKDGIPVVIHDGTLERTTNGTGRVTETTYSELSRLDAGSWFDPRFSSEKIPTFEEVLQLIRKQSATTHIAINMKEISHGIEERIVRLIEKYNLLDRVFAFGMDESSMKRFKAANPKFPVCGRATNRATLLSAAQDDSIDYIWISAGDGYDPSREEVAIAHAAGKRLVIYLQVNQPDRWRSAVQAGVDGICTDFPLEALKLVRQ